MDYTQVIKDVGDFVSGKIIGNAIEWVSSLGVTLTPQAEKFITLVIILALVYILIKFINALSKPIKWTIVILLILVGISVVMSFI